MALIVLDPCQMGFMPNPGGGTIKISEVDGFPGIEFMIPLNDETLSQFNQIIAEKLKPGPKIVVAGAHEAPTGVRDHG